MADDNLEKQLNEGKRHFMRMEWSQAEEMFFNILRCIETCTNNNWYPQYDMLKVDTLTSLGELETRRCRRFCYDDMTWFKGMFRALTFYNDALACIIRRRKHLGNKVESGKEKNGNKILKNLHKLNGLESTVEENAFFNQAQGKIMFQIKTIEESTNKILIDKIFKNCLASSNGRTLTFNDEWLRQMALFCSEEKNTQPPHQRCNERAKSFDQTNVQQDQKQLGQHKEENFQPAYKRKIDFDRVQEAIMKLVNDVSIDVRRNYNHVTRLVPQQLIQQRLMLEVTRRLTPGSRDNVDLMKVLENAIVYEDVNQTTGLGKSSKRTSECNASFTDQTTIVDFDEDKDNDRTIYMNIETCQPESITMKMNNRKFSNMDDGAESHASLLTNVKEFTRASSPSCYSKKSHTGRFLHHIDVASSGRLSQTKTISSKKSGLIYEINGMPTKATRMKNILTVWRSHKPRGAPSGASSNTTTCQRRCFYNDLQNFEEVSPLSEREKVLNWLKSVEEPSSTTTTSNAKLPASKSNQGIISEYPQSSHNQSTSGHQHEQNKNGNLFSSCQLTKEKLNYTVATVAKKSAENLSDQGNYSEALEVFKFALSILKANSTGLRHEKEFMAELLRNIGMTKCSLGQISVGCQLMQESVGLYSKLENMSDSSRISEIWFQLGGAFLSEELRKDSLFLRTMQLIQKELDNENTKDILNCYDDNNDYDDDSSQCSESSEKEDGYCVCIHEAMECYKQSINLFNNLGQNGLLLNSELYIHVLCNLADCYFMAGNLDLAEVHYEEALLLFPRARGSPTMQENSHVLSMLGSLNFMLGNYVRAATMYETSHILNQHRNVGRHDEPTLQQAWNIAMLGLSCYYLGHFDKTVAWCTRAFTLYTRVLRGSLFNADYYNHWFVIENLYSLGTAYATMNFFEKAIYYLNLGRNLINGCEVSDRQDPKQHVKVLRALADSHASVEESDVALKFYEEAVEISKKLGENNSKTALQNQLLNSMASVNVDSKNYTDAGNNLEQALDYQKDVEMSIKLDMVAVLKRLGATSVLACDVDKAIGCYKDCIQATKELSWLPNQWEDIACMLCTLATLYHVKSCTLDDENQMELFMTMSEGCFQEAIVITEDNPLDIRIEVECAVDLQYANFLYQQGLYADALHVLLPTTFCKRPQLNDLVYSGIEQAVLPDHLQSDFYDDSMIIDAKTFAYFLAILCYKNVGLTSDADDVLVSLFKSALNPRSSAFLCNVCSYALLEMGMYREACEMFYSSATVKSIYSLSGNKAAINFYLSLCLFVYISYNNILHAIYGYLRKMWKNSNKSKKVEKKITHENESVSSIKRQQSSQDGSDLVFCSDSGEMVETWEEWTEETIPESRKVHWDEKTFAPNIPSISSSSLKQNGEILNNLTKRSPDISTVLTNEKKTSPENSNKLTPQEQRYQEFLSTQQQHRQIQLQQEQQRSQQQSQQQQQYFQLQKPEKQSPQFSDSSTYSNTSDYSSQALNYSREISDDVWKDDVLNVNEASNEDEDEISETFEEIVYDVNFRSLGNNFNDGAFKTANNIHNNNNLQTTVNKTNPNLKTLDTNLITNSPTKLNPIDDDEKLKNDIHNRKRNEMSFEINGNLKSTPEPNIPDGNHPKSGQSEIDPLDEYEEWITIEEVVDTPIEILAILNKNNLNNNNFNNNNNNNNIHNNNNNNNNSKNGDNNGRMKFGLYA